MKKIKPGYILPSAAFTINRKQIVYRDFIDKKPEAGDLVYGSIVYIGQHKSLENCHGRIHSINDGTKAIFVYANRYAPDAFEGLVPDETTREVDLLTRSGMIGRLVHKNSNVSDCTKVKIYGYVLDNDKKIVNTRKIIEKELKRRIKSKMILCIGSAMNSGKSYTAASCCFALSSMGHKVNACKVTGTASLKDILLMEDNGASNVADFTYLGYPSTYMLSREETIKIFSVLDAQYGSVQGGYWVVEFADGVLQRETAFLLESEEVRSRIHKLIFCSQDSCGVIGGLQILRQKYNLIPDAVSGLCGSSPLAVREAQEFTDLPFFNSMARDLNLMSEILL